jgi:hypothetical protein
VVRSDRYFSFALQSFFRKKKLAIPETDYSSSKDDKLQISVVGVRHGKLTFLN